MADQHGSKQNVTFPAPGGEAHGYLRSPDSGRGPGVVVIQEWWGLTSHIAGLVDRLAAEGFVALAPDLYGGATTHDAAEAGQMMQDLPVDRATRDLSGAVDFLLAQEDVLGDRVGLIGFCMGGSFVPTMAAQEGGKVGAAVAFYPAGPTPEDYAGLQAAVQGHFAEQDGFVPLAVADEIKARIKAGTGHDPEIHTYPAGHAFLNDENLVGTYDPDQAKIAWERAVSFLRANLA